MQRGDRRTDGCSIVHALTLAFCDQVGEACDVCGMPQVVDTRLFQGVFYAVCGCCDADGEAGFHRRQLRHGWLGCARVGTRGRVARIVKSLQSASIACKREGVSQKTFDRWARRRLRLN
jgi:hypothetical protein